jgi:hypothetical protein
VLPLTGVNLFNFILAVLNVVITVSHVQNISLNTEENQLIYI